VITFTRFPWLEDGDVKFYAEAEAVLSQLKRRGTPMIL
jgi:hypothetical protein